MHKRCKIRFSSFVNFCESPNFQNQEIDIVIVVVGVRRVAKKSHIDVRCVRRIRRVSSDAEVDKIEVSKSDPKMDAIGFVDGRWRWRLKNKVEHQHVQKV